MDTMLATRPDWLAFAAPVDVLVTHPAPSWRPGQVIDAHPVDGAPDVWRARVAVLTDTGRYHVARTYTAHRSSHVDSLVRPASSDRPPMLTPEALHAL